MAAVPDLGAGAAVGGEDFTATGAKTQSGFGSGRSGRTGPKNPFWGALKPSSLGAAGQSTPTAFHVASTPQNTPGFAAITTGFGAVTQPTSCGTSTSGFGSTISAPFTSMVSAGPTGSGGLGTGVPAPH
ncbi:putative nuclear envelope pore membrane protein POM 121B, partial [Manis pentadactyla]|uniref:putative nuclear envelope pore membrane protein POM 121B n=1 Tax=Manis pentadactyla TaxID=143292 RepID=UPI00255CEB4D